MVEALQNNISTTKTHEQLGENEAFQEIVAQLDDIELRLSPDDLEQLRQEPTNKPSGYADQGYRHG